MQIASVGSEPIAVVFADLFQATTRVEGNVLPVIGEIPPVRRFALI